MASNWAERDSNFVPTLLAVSSVDGVSVVDIWADPTTHRLLVDLAGGGGGVAAFLQTQVFTATNNQTVFTVTGPVAYTLYLSENGLIQTPTTDYSVSVDTYTLTSGVPTGTIVIILYATG